MTEPYSSDETTRTYQSFHAFGFEIPLTNDGRRIWTPRFKRFVVAQMNDRAISVKQVEQECQVSKSQIYQWKMEAAGKPITARERRHCEHQTFTEIKVEHYEEVREKSSAGHMQVGTAPLITLQTAKCLLSLPATYPVSALVTLIEAIEQRP